MEHDAMRAFHPFCPAYQTVISHRVCIRFTETAKILVFPEDEASLVHQFHIRNIAEKPG